MTTRGLERQDILDFVEAGGNVVVFANSDYEEPTSKLFESFGCELDEPKSLVLDHIHYSKDWDSQFGGKHAAVIADGVCQSSVIVGDNKSTIIYHGIGMGIFPKREWIFPILWGSPCSYSYFPDTRVVELPIVSGEETVMVAGLQSRNGARVLLTGSTDICANTLPKKNSAFCSWVVRWALGQRGMLRIRNWRHRTLMNQSTVSFSSSSNPTTYRVEDEVEFSMDMEEWDGIERRWKPFIAKDVQLEFIMLDPYIRKNLSVTEKGSYSTRFRIPDRIGVYKFSVEYYRRGYSPVRLSQEVSVRPFRHDEYERFILQAYPYYAAAWSMLLGVVIFGFLFLHGKMNQ